jgi:hypothetical protein
MQQLVAITSPSFLPLTLTHQMAPPHLLSSLMQHQKKHLIFSPSFPMAALFSSNKTIGLAKTTPLYLSSQAPHKDPNYVIKVLSLARALLNNYRARSHKPMY